MLPPLACARSVIQPRFLESALRHVSHHNVSGGYKPPLHFPARLSGGIQSKTALVAVDLQERRPDAVFAADLADNPVLSAINLLDANHVRSEVAQQCSAPRSGDVPPEVDDSHSFKYTRHQSRFLTISQRLANRHDSEGEL